MLYVHILVFFAKVTYFNIYYIISNQSEAHILLTRGIFEAYLAYMWNILRHVSCLLIESFEAYILLTRGIIFKATARSIVGTPLPPAMV